MFDLDSEYLQEKMNVFSYCMATYKIMFEIGDKKISKTKIYILLLKAISNVGGYRFLKKYFIIYDNDFLSLNDSDINRNVMLTVRINKEPPQSINIAALDSIFRYDFSGRVSKKFPVKIVEVNYSILGNELFNEINKLAKEYSGRPSTHAFNELIKNKQRG